ncbi:flagellar biosynthesis protein FlhA [Microbulbifer rhizosphaerae]|uniref:Flagellar biosynthesis protein FlhA n=1 Tax=Microbulbifer rhizosphaerae TaxID=1562603 RepID=A0A7W4WFY1_9GAMM|nr:flagellar biosynthesis protein FlhA [Microbulbifer rhizosphaerae]MBB3063482.1 flagellar biosynthesis protein FlhA [Microbulbifer rhizosphaerae]
MLERTFGTKSEIALVVGVIGILVVLFAPIPSGILDFLLLFNFSTALLILLLTFYMDRPVEFSTFPAILLIATLLRLSLNIAATRLILSEGDAGDVIGAVGEYVVGGNYVVGLVVFFILIVVQYIVVTSGAQRVAEVAARFTLDSMPGKQMSIDADLNMGLIDEKEAQKRRKDIEREANFYGSMDGASKFVKGDAVAGIIIILIDIIGGLTVGIAQIGMSWGDALHTYTLMTVGDGIVTQIPALIISTATGIIITRASSDSFLGNEIGKQLARYPKSLVLVCIALLIFSFLPGIPLWPIAILLLIFAPFAVLALKSQKDLADSDIIKDDDRDQESEQTYTDIVVEPLEIHVGEELGEFLSSEAIFLEKVRNFRNQYAQEMGVIIPKVKVSVSKKLSSHAYEIRIFNTRVGRSECYPEKYLAISATSKISISGIETKDPSYGLPAVWIDSEQKLIAKEKNFTVVDPVTVLFTHFTEIIRQHAGEFVTRRETEALLSKVKVSQPGLYDELIPDNMSLSDIQKVLKSLLREKVPITNIELVAEALVDKSRITKDIPLLVEMVRQQLGRVICEPLLDADGILQVLTLDPLLERKLSESILQVDGVAKLSVDPRLVEKFTINLVKSTEKMVHSGRKPVLLCSANLRYHLRQLIERFISHIFVISLSEVPNTVQVQSFSIVTGGTLAEGTKKEELVA